MYFCVCVFYRYLWFGRWAGPLILLLLWGLRGSGWTVVQNGVSSPKPPAPQRSLQHRWKNISVFKGVCVCVCEGWGVGCGWQIVRGTESGRDWISLYPNVHFLPSTGLLTDREPSLDFGAILFRAKIAFPVFCTHTHTQRETTPTGSLINLLSLVCYPSLMALLIKVLHLPSSLSLPLIPCLVFHSVVLSVIYLLNKLFFIEAWIFPSLYFQAH